MSIELRGVSKVYPGGVRAVEPINLTVPAGGSLGLVGGSGSGKTTLLKMINRLLEPTTGQVLIEGEDAARADVYAHRQRFGYVVQRGGLFPHLSVEQNVALPGRLRNWEASRLRERVATLLGMVELPYDSYASRYPTQLSGGQQQRVGIARALFLDPPYLLLDEPLGALDPVTRRGLQEQILQLNQEQGKTVVVVTHDMAEATMLAAQVAVMRTGQMLQKGTPEQLKSAPADEFVRLLFEA